MAASIGSPFRLVLVAVDDDLASAWDRSCRDLPGVEIYRGSILDVKSDAVVSPANSFGFMNGGIDALYARRFGARLVSRVRDQILEHHGGELLVGDAEVIETADSDIPFLICAPTMRVPMLVSDTVNPATLAEASTRHEALAVERSRR
jgi:O-acetyl-ADP-ribose deacetylase (regulator of RNase III)